MPSITSLYGRPVHAYTSPDCFSTGTPDTVRISMGYDTDFDEKMSFEDVWRGFCESQELSSITQLIIGAWAPSMDVGAEQIIPAIVEQAHHFTALTALFLGDIDGEENEISWIENGDVGPLLNAFPQLTYFGTRGGNGLSFESCTRHEHLKTLVVETGGLHHTTVESVLKMSLPELTTLELWLGSSDYGFTGDVDTYLPLLIGRPYPDTSYPFPELKHLGLLNSEIADDLARGLMDSTLLDQLKTLDLSMGVMSDEGVRALLDNNKIDHLDTLDLSHNYIRDLELFRRLEARGIKVISSGQKDEGTYGRYVDVGE